MKIHPTSAWSKDKIDHYLGSANTPLRISCIDRDGYPIICSLWFIYEAGELWSASHKNSHIVKALKNSRKIALEVASNEYPYHGIRGKANITLVDDSSGLVLNKVIDKYLQGGNKSLSNWLLSRKEDEYAIKISPIMINSWDFSTRMTSPS
jgi:nitroimidazol reductase NimA-like FMN-containing flavoprotein (pyridoxamine 5'-phosphate oxidase superfamily)